MIHQLTVEQVSAFNTRRDGMKQVGPRSHLVTDMTQEDG